MKTAQAWTEEITYVDCPECGSSIELGSGIVVGSDCEEDCPDCGEVFKVEAPE